VKRKAQAKKRPAAVENEDPRFAAVVNALAAEPGFAPVISAYAASKKEGGRKFGSNGLKVNGKLFAMVSSKGNLVVKLPKQRVDGIVASGQGENFDPGHGRLMKEWVAILSTKVSWIALVREAHDFVKKANA
jgi:hypothetical protein